MKCPFCGDQESKVVDSRHSEDGLSIRRRRECMGCQRRFTTYEIVESLPIIVVKLPGAMSWGVISTYRPSVSSSIPVISRYTVSASTGSRNNEKRAAANITDSSPPATNFLSIPNPPDFFRVSSRNPRKIIAGLAADSVQPAVNDLPFVSEVPLSIREYSTAIFRHFTAFELIHYILRYNTNLIHNMW